MGPVLGSIAGRGEAFPRDENPHHRAPNGSQPLDAPEMTMLQLSPNHAGLPS